MMTMDGPSTRCFRAGRLPSLPSSSCSSAAATQKLYALSGLSGLPFVARCTPVLNPVCTCMWDPELVALAFCLQEISPPKDIWMRHAYLTYDYLTSTREGGNWDGESVLVGLVNLPASELCISLVCIWCVFKGLVDRPHYLLESALSLESNSDGRSLRMAVQSLAPWAVSPNCFRTVSKPRPPSDLCET